MLDNRKVSVNLSIFPNHQSMFDSDFGQSRLFGQFESFDDDFGTGRQGAKFIRDDFSIGC